MRAALARVAAWLNLWTERRLPHDRPATMDSPVTVALRSMERERAS